MAKRGPPRHADILTPREWEVLEFLRQGLSNPEIAERLGISRDGAKYHVSEILAKLGVASREEAALWSRPAEERRPWWTAASAPLAFVWRRLPALSPGLNSVAMAVSIGVVAAALGGIGLIVFLLLPDGDKLSPAVVSEPATPDRHAVEISEPGVYLIRPDGSGLRRLPGAGRARDVLVWAPSGDRFAVARGCQQETELFVGTAGDEELEKVASLPSDVGWIYWSPREDAVAVNLSKGQGIAAQLVDLDSGEVTTIQGASSFLGWSHDGHWYAVRDEADANWYERTVTVVDAETGKRTTLAEGAGGILWSPVDDRLAVIQMDGPQDPPYNTWLASGVDVVRADGTERTVLLPIGRHVVTRTSGPSAWSPDGSRLLVHTATDRMLLYDLGASREPVDLGGVSGGGTWSPDGSHIAVHRPGSFERAMFIEILPADGGPGTEVSVSADLLSRDPRFSPDGQRLVFLENRPGFGGEDLYLTNVHGGAPKLLTTVDSGLSMSNASWSADGSHIAFEAGPVNGYTGDCE